jgi:hypothetical protein
VSKSVYELGTQTTEVVPTFQGPLSSLQTHEQGLSGGDGYTGLCMSTQ